LEERSKGLEMPWRKNRMKMPHYAKCYYWKLYLWVTLQRDFLKN